MRIVVVEPYFTGSHRAWAEGYAAVSNHDVRLVTHDGRFWKWRMQGAALTLATELTDQVSAHGSPDVLLASSMTNLPSLLGLVRRDLGDPAVVLYMHENQLTYPVSPRDLPDASYAMGNWLSMAAADLVLFNSDYHRRVWFDALPRFLKQFPDYRHEPPLIDAVKVRSEVLPVGIDLGRLDGPSFRTEPPLILWNQRCEYDKGPGDFVDAMLELDRRGCEFRVALAGERFVSEPSDFDRLRNAAGHRIAHDGYADDATYAALLRSADLVVSTARQEFFGIAVTEAVYAGAFPLFPDRLVYPERLPTRHHRLCLYGDRADLVAKLEWALRHAADRVAIAGELRTTMAAFDWSAIAPVYDERLEALAR